jgi:ABC-type nitrate/sulfonate/bicarbonate transport system substrate-binding protein
MAPVFFLSAALLVAAGPAHGQAARKISIGLSSASLVAAAPRIAKEMGLFEKHGLDVKFIIMESANAATAALISKSIDVALAGPGEVIAAQIRGQRVVLIASVYSGLGASLILSKPVADSTGVSPTAPVIDRLKALDGIVIGTSNATSPYTVAFRGATKAAGSSPRFTYVSVPAMAASLETGAIHGFIASAPFWATPVLKGSGVIWISGPKGELPPENMPKSSIGLAVLRDVAAADPALIKKITAVVSDLNEALDERPAEVKAAAARLFPELDGQAFELLFASESPAWRSRPITVKDIAHEIGFVKSTGASLPGIDAIDPASLLFP